MLAVGHVGLNLEESALKGIRFEQVLAETPTPKVTASISGRVSMRLSARGTLAGVKLTESGVGTDEVRIVKIAMPPGRHMVFIAQILFSPKTYDRVFAELINDIRLEHFEALRAGHTKRARWIAVRGWASFLHVLVIQPLLALMDRVLRIGR